MTFNRHSDDSHDLSLLHQFDYVRKVSSINQTYGPNPPGNINIIKLINNQDCYPKLNTTAASAEYIKKTIFISDPTLGITEFIPITLILSELIRTLIEQYNFDVYTHIDKVVKIEANSDIYSTLRLSVGLKLEKVKALSSCEASNLHVLHFHNIRTEVPELYMKLHGTDAPLSKRILMDDFIRYSYLMPQTLNTVAGHSSNYLIDVIESYGTDRPLPVIIDSCTIEDITRIAGTLVSRNGLDVMLFNVLPETSECLFSVLNGCHLQGLSIYHDVENLSNFVANYDTNCVEFLRLNIKNASDVARIASYLQITNTDRWSSLKKYNLVMNFNIDDDIYALLLPPQITHLSVTIGTYFHPLFFKIAKQQCPQLMALSIVYGKHAEKLVESTATSRLCNPNVAIELINRDAVKIVKNGVSCISTQLGEFFDAMKEPDSLLYKPDHVGEVAPKVIVKEIDNIVRRSNLKNYLENTRYIFIPTVNDSGIDAFMFLVLMKYCKKLVEVIIEEIYFSPQSIDLIEKYFKNCHETQPVLNCMALTIMACSNETIAESNPLMPIRYFIERYCRTLMSLELNLDHKFDISFLRQIISNLNLDHIKIASRIPEEKLKILRNEFMDRSIMITGNSQCKELDCYDELDERNNNICQNKPTTPKEIAENLTRNLSLSHTPLTAEIYFKFKSNNFPDPVFYRLEVNTPDEIVILPIPLPKNNNPKSVYTKLENVNNLFFGRKILFLSHEWQPLPSLSASQEEIIALSVSGNPEIQLGKSQQTGLHYLKCHEAANPQKVTIDYVLLSTLNDPFISPLTSEHSADIQASFQQLRFDNKGHFVANAAANYISQLDERTLVAEAILFFKTFKPNKKIKKKDYEHLLGYDFINFCIEHTIGACRTRSEICYLVLSAFGVNPKNFKLIINDLHAYIEYCNNPFNLNGYNCETKLNAMPASLEEITENIKKTVAINTEQKQLLSNNRFIMSQKRKVEIISSGDQITTLLNNLAYSRDTSRRQEIWVVENENQVNLLRRAVIDSLKNNTELSLQVITDLRNPEFFMDVVSNDSDLAKTETELLQVINTPVLGSIILISDQEYHPSLTNKLFDEQRRLCDHHISPDIALILVMTTHSLNTDSSDLESRFAAIRTIQLNYKIDLYADILGQSAPNLLDQSLHVMTTYTENDADFVRRLIGTITLNEQFRYIPGELVKAIESRRNLCIVNPPKSSRHYSDLLSQIVHHRAIKLQNGTVLAIPDDFRIYHIDRPYDLAGNYYVIEADAIPAKCTEVLNTSTFNEFVQHTYKAKNKYPERVASILEQYKNNHLHVYVTESLAEAGWAELFQRASEHQCLLYLYVPKVIKLPNALVAKKKNGAFYENNFEERNKKLSIITSQDTEYAATRFKFEFIQAKIGSVISINIDNETNYADITGRITRTSLKPLQIEFIKSHVLEALENGTNVILYGDEIASELYQLLQRLLLSTPYLYANGERKKINGHIYLIVKDKYKLGYTPDDNNHIDASIPMYLTFLEHIYPKIIVDLAAALVYAFKNRVPSFEFNYQKILQIAQHIDLMPCHNPLMPLLHLEEKSEEIAAAKLFWEIYKFNRTKPDPTNGHALKYHLTQKMVKRLNLFGRINVVGETGTSKSALIGALSPIAQPFYQGIEYFRDWLSNGGTLFIDEFNTLSIKVQRLLNGYLSESQCILYEGKLYSVNKKTHKLILAGNHTYYGNRKYTSQSHNCGHAILFKPCANAYLRDIIILPILKCPSSPIQMYAFNIAEKLISDYTYFNSVLPKKSQLTPRNLRMISLRILLFLELNTHLKIKNMDQLINLSMYHELKPLLAVAAASDLHDKINSMINDNLTQVINRYLESILGDFHHELTPSQINVAYDIVLHVLLYRMCRHNPSLMSTPISGVLLHGLPGIGKSMLLVGILKALGYKQYEYRADVEAIDAQLRNSNYFIYTTPGDPITLVNQIKLVERYGWPMILDELNTLQPTEIPDTESVESALNRALSNIDEQCTLNGTSRPLILSSMNPATLFANRAILPLTILSRFIRMDYPEPTEADLEFLALKKHIAENPQSYVQEYMDAKQFLTSQGNFSLTLRTFNSCIIKPTKRHIDQVVDATPLPGSKRQKSNKHS